MRSDSEDPDATEKDMTPQSPDGDFGRPQQSKVVMSDVEYLREPEKAFRAMRRGITVVVEPTNGGTRMVLFGELLSDLPA